MNSIILQHITKYLKRITAIPQEKKVLGRWAIDYCNTKTNNKIDWSNEDHCGPCGQYALEKQSDNHQDKPKDHDKPKDQQNGKK